MTETTSTIVDTIGNDGTKLLEAIPAITTAYNAAMSSLSADQHKTVLTQVADLVQAVTPSVTAAANAGLIGQTDASHATTIGDAITTGASQATFWQSVINAIRGWF